MSVSIRWVWVFDECHTHRIRWVWVSDDDSVFIVFIVVNTVCCIVFIVVNTLVNTLSSSYHTTMNTLRWTRDVMSACRVTLSACDTMNTEREEVWYDNGVWCDAQTQRNKVYCDVMHYTATHCKHTATRCHTLQHRGTQCIMMWCTTLQHIVNTLQHAATHCNTEGHSVLWCDALHCNTL